MTYPPPRPRRLRMAAILAGAALAASGLGWLVLAHRAQPAPTVQPATAPASRLPVPSASPSPAAPLITAADLAGLRWSDFYGVEMPSSPSAGPLHARAGLAWGFTDTPLGALLAAVNIGVRANAQWGPGVFAPTIARQVSGPAAPALLAACQSYYQSERLASGARPGQPLGPVFASEEAFRWVSYSQSAATVDIASDGPGPQGATAQAATEISLTWSGGDWRVVAPPGGDWGNSAAPLASLRGYTLFPIP